MKKILFTAFLVFPLIGLSQSIISEAIFPIIDIRPIMSMNIKPSGKGFSYDFSNTRDLQNGIEHNRAFDVEIKSNTNWQLMMNTDSDYFYDVVTGTPGEISSNVLQLKKDKSGFYQSASVVSTVIASGSRGGAKSKQNNFALDMFVNPGETAAGGDYVLQLIFTISSQ